MERLLLKTNAAVQDCERHLQSSGSYGTEIESYLTQYLLVVMCADVQQEIYRIAEERASTARDLALSSFVAASTKKVLRSVGKREIATFVEMFGPDCKAKLNSGIDDADVTVYNNAVCFRHDVAHNQGSLITFAELKRAVAVAEKLLTATAQSIASGPSGPNIA